MFAESLSSTPIAIQEWKVSVDWNLQTHRINSGYENNAEDENGELAADDRQVRYLDSKINIAENVDFFSVHVYLPWVEQHHQNRNVLLRVRVMSTQDEKR